MREKVMFSLADLNKMSDNEIDIYLNHLLRRYKTLGDSRYMIIYYIIAIFRDNSASKFIFENYLTCLSNTILSLNWNSYDEDKIEDKNDLLQWVKENLVGRLTIKRRK